MIPGDPNDMQQQSPRAFTIVEMLVVVSIIALLAGILIPAINKARDQAQLTKSQSNLRNLGTAHANYASEWEDRQFTLALDNITSYGDSILDAVQNYAAAQADDALAPNTTDYPPPIQLGWYQPPGGDREYSAIYMIPGADAENATLHGMEPITFEASNPALVGFGYFRLPNVKAFNQYLGGRFYDEIFYAPKDTAVLDVVTRLFDDPNEYVPTAGAGGWYDGSNDDLNLSSIALSSYCLSPAALFAPQVLGNPEQGGYRDPWSLNAGLRAPSMGQVRYSTQKTHMIEHHWLQQRRALCNPNVTGGRYNYCEPYYFNHGWESVPVALFYDGHVEGVGTRAAQAADSRMRAQTQDPDWGLWSNDTPLGGAPDGGYFMGLGYDFIETSFHILTTEGAQGRDVLAQ
jgi:prepilin-type N-terminal cleavage/methylation domain-containing protein